MTYGEIKKLVLDLIFSDTIAGDQIPNTYNNQADYVKAIPSLINDGQIYVATTVKRIPAMHPLTTPAYSTEGFDVYLLPKNCWRMMHGGLMHERKDEFGHPTITRFHDYKLFGGDKLYIPKGMTGLTLEYWRYPAHLKDNPKDFEELDNTEEVHAALAYYVAAELLMYDDAFRHATLWNAWEARLARMTEPVFVESGEVEDAYGFSFYS